MLRHLLAAAVFLLGSVPFADAQSPSPASVTADMAARVELHAFPSLTLSDQQFLTSDKGGTTVTLTGELRIAQGSGKLPLVILVHGSGGMGGNIEAWSRHLNGKGISTFAIDGFTGRGLTVVNSNQALLGRLNFIVDIYRALAVVAKHPRVDASRIALMGFSRGGQAALYASLERFHKAWNTSGLDFEVYIPFYPDCATTFVADEEIGSRKVRIFHGTADDYNPVATCRTYVNRLSAAKRDVILTEYDGAHHSFDNPLGARKPTAAPHSQSVRDCTVRETNGGVLLNTATNAPFTYKDACVVLGPHTGFDPQATGAATKSVTEILRSAFKLGG